jgi:hypothetical protein
MHPLWAVVAALPLLASPASAQGTCYGPWLRCLLSPACARQQREMKACIFAPEGFGPCLERVYREPVPALLSLTDCLQQLSGHPPEQINYYADIEGVRPEQVCRRLTWRWAQGAGAP